MSGTQLNFSYIYTPVKLFDLTILFWYFNVKYVIINPMKESRLTKKINEKALNILEFNKVISHLTDYADSDPAKNICGRIKPFTDKEKVNESLDQTNDALRRIYAKGKVSFRGIVSVREMVKRLNAGATLNTIELLRLGDLLECASHVMNYYEPSQDSLSPFFDALVNIPELESEIRRCIISEEEINDNASPELKNIRRMKSGFRDRIQGALNSIINSGLRNCLQEPVITMRCNRYCLPVKSENRPKIPGILHDRSSTGSTLFIEPSAVVELSNELTELEAEEKKEIERILSRISSIAAQHTDIITADADALIRLDVTFAKAAYAREIRAVRPIINTDRYIDLKQARHPLLDALKVVPVDVSIGKGYSLLIITGPNTGGKTVTLKTTGLLCLMAQAGLNIPAAEKSSVCIFTDIFADIGDEQSIEQSLSTFSSHMTNIAKIVNAADPNSLILFDEIGAGTDPVEGAALATAILDSLRDRGILTMASTHYSELKVYAMTTEGVENAGCEFDVNTLRPTYHLLIGVPGKSNAFAIAGKLGLPPDLIEDAGRRLTHNEARFEDLISDLDMAKRSAARDFEAAAREREILEALRAEAEELKITAKEAKEKILRNANEEAARILSQAAKDAKEAAKAIRKKDVSHEEIKNTESSLRTRADKKLEKIQENLKTRKKRSDDRPEDFVPGTRVYVLSMDLEGDVCTSPDSKGNVNVSIGSFTTVINIKELEIIKRVSDQNQNRTGLKGTTSGSASAIKVRGEKASGISTEINLLGKRADEAIGQLDKYLDDACLSGLSQVRIIHGKGTGALRAAIQRYLNSHCNISEFRNGTEDEGGDGATIAIFK